MSNYEMIGSILLVLILGIAVKLLLAQLRHTTKDSVRCGITGGVFLLYTGGLILLLRQTYQHVRSINADVEYYHQAVILTVVIANIVVLFAGILYFSVGGKHRLSQADKMKLKDL